MDKEGVRQTDRDSIADVFADFYADLYRKRYCHSFVMPSDEDFSCAPITATEIATQLKLMTNKKCADANGIVAEILKHGTDKLLDLLCKLFNDLLKPDMEPPLAWKQTRLKVLFKKGNPLNAENYRPISILPTVYKLFSKVLCARIKQQLETEQSVDQAGIRSGFSCDDHIFAISILSEGCAEFRRPLWVVAVDFKKALDTVEQPSIWTSLLEQGVPAVYVDTLMRLYDGQTCAVQTDRVSKNFSIERGTRQGDPISPSLFNSSLEGVMRKAKHSWKKKQFGVDVGSVDRLTNLRFADDLLLIGGSFYQVEVMLSDLMTIAGHVGLEIHPNKTKIIWNGYGRRRRSRTATIKGQSFDILQPTACTDYLGRSLTFDDAHNVELQNRINKAWRKFAMFREELTDKAYPLRQRLRLFKSVIQPSVLNGCVSWVMTRDRENMLRSTQRKMMRTILGRMCQPRDTSGDADAKEQWLDWLRNVTH